MAVFESFSPAALLKTIFLTVFYFSHTYAVGLSGRSVCKFFNSSKVERFTVLIGSSSSLGSVLEFRTGLRNKQSASDDK